MTSYCQSPIAAIPRPIESLEVETTAARKNQKIIEVCLDDMDTQRSSHTAFSPAGPPHRHAVVELRQSSNAYRETTRVVVISQARREKYLEQLLRKLSPQADEVFVYLPNESNIPKGLIVASRNIRFFTGPEIGSKAKFLFLQDYTGYYITVEDDISYSRYHVASLVAGIERYDRRAVVGWHGRQVASDPKIDPAMDEKVIDSGSELSQDTIVQSLSATGWGFHTDTLRMEDLDIDSSDSADAALQQAAHQREVPLIVLAHADKQTLPLREGSQLQEPPQLMVASSGYHVSNTQSQDANSAEASVLANLRKHSREDDRSPRVSIIGRASTSRWKKGGILKSVLLTKEMLNSHGCAVELVDIVDGNVFNLDRPDILMVYVGDPERPDFKKVHKIVEYHAQQGLPILVNLSEDNYHRRTAEIQKVMNDWHERFRGQVSMMTFSLAVESKTEYQNFRNSIVTIPKTLTFAHHKYAEYESTHGIFIGDVAKLSDPRIVGNDATERISLLRSAIPEAKIYGIRQYIPKYDIPPGIDEVWPFMSASELMTRLAHVRLMVSFPKYATYEMVPVETAAIGVPVLYPDMPQSLNEAIGLAGVRYRDTFDLINSAQTLYRNPLVWRQYSQAGIRRAHSQDFDVASAQMYLTIKNFLERHRMRKFD